MTGGQVFVMTWGGPLGCCAPCVAPTWIIRADARRRHDADCYGTEHGVVGLLPFDGGDVQQVRQRGLLSWERGDVPEHDWRAVADRGGHGQTSPLEGPSRVPEPAGRRRRACSRVR